MKLKNCLVCGKELHGIPMFCSKKCEKESDKNPEIYTHKYEKILKDRLLAKKQLEIIKKEQRVKPGAGRYRGEASSHIIRKTTKHNKTGDNYSITIPKKIAQKNSRVYFEHEELLNGDLLLKRTNDKKQSTILNYKEYKECLECQKKFNEINVKFDSGKKLTKKEEDIINQIPFYIYEEKYKFCPICKNKLIKKPMTNEEIRNIRNIFEKVRKEIKEKLKKDEN